MDITIEDIYLNGLKNLDLVLYSGYLKKPLYTYSILLFINEARRKNQ